MSPTIAPAYCLEVTGHGTGRGNPHRAQQTPWVEKTELSLGRPRELEFVGCSAREGNAARERTREGCRGFSLSIQYMTHMYVRKLLEAEERTT